MLLKHQKHRYGISLYHFPNIPNNHWLLHLFHFGPPPGRGTHRLSDKLLGDKVPIFVLVPSLVDELLNQETTEPFGPVLLVHTEYFAIERIYNSIPNIQLYGPTSNHCD